MGHWINEGRNKEVYFSMAAMYECIKLEDLSDLMK